jgi:hypothetical protein
VSFFYAHVFDAQGMPQPTSQDGNRYPKLLTGNISGAQVGYMLLFSHTKKPKFIKKYECIVHMIIYNLAKLEM